MATARAGAALVGVEIVAGRRPRRFGTASVAGDRELVTGDCGGGSQHEPFPKARSSSFRASCLGDGCLQRASREVCLRSDLAMPAQLPIVDSLSMFLSMKASRPATSKAAMAARSSQIPATDTPAMRVTLLVIERFPVRVRASAPSESGYGNGFGPGRVDLLFMKTCLCRPIRLCCPGRRPRCLSSPRPSLTGCSGKQPRKTANATFGSRAASGCQVSQGRQADV
jgi:hypothetical protein